MLQQITTKGVDFYKKKLQPSHAAHVKDKHYGHSKNLPRKQKSQLRWYAEKRLI